MLSEGLRLETVLYSFCIFHAHNNDDKNFEGSLEFLLYVYYLIFYRIVDARLPKLRVKTLMLVQEVVNYEISS